MIQSKKAFTLIELLVVIAIVSILSALVLANVTTAKSKSRDVKRISDINQLQLVVQLYFDKCGQYPAASASLPVLGTSGSTGSGCPSGINLDDFISQIPTPPSGSSVATPYTYIVKTDGTDFYLGVKLENTGNQVLTDDVDGTVGGTGWTGSIDAADTSPNPMYVVTSK